MSWGDFKTDFEKLLVANSPIRIFVTRDFKSSNYEMSLAKKIEFATLAVQNFTALKKGDCVYLIVWDEINLQGGDFRLIKIIKE